MKRALVTLSLVLALLPSICSADLDGTRRQERDHRRCARLGQHYQRHGLTNRERATLVRRNCKQLPNGTWTTALYYAAEE